MLVLKKEKKAPKLYNRKSIKRKFLMIYFYLVLLPCVLMIVYSLNLYSKYVINSIIASKYNTLHAINETIDTKLEQYQNIGTMIYYNEIVMEVLEEPYWSKSDEKIITGYLSSIVNAEPYIESAMITKGSKTCIAGNVYQDIDLYISDITKKLKTEKTAMKWLPTVQLYNNYGHEVFPLVCYRAINNDTGQIGTLWLFISSRLCNRIINSDFKYHEGDIYIMDNEQTVVASNNVDLVSKVYDGMDSELIIDNARGNFRNDNKEIVIYEKSYETGWYIINVTPINVMLKENNRIILFVGGLVVLGLISITLIYIYMSSRLTKPLDTLKKGLDRVAQGDFDYKLYKNSKSDEDEIGELTNTYNYMIDKIQILMEQIREEEELKNKEKIKLLSMQIGPHFIYNTLNSLKWMAMINKQENIRKMTESLIKLLMNSTYEIGEMITLRQEIELLECYVYIQRIRYGNFIINFDIPDELRECKVGKMLLQPIVENCIIHGFSGKSGIGTIKIAATASGNDLIISIEDNGKVSDSNNYSMQSHKKSIGLGNIQERIKLNFGSEYYCTIKGEKGIGTTVKLKLPLIMEEFDKKNNYGVKS